MWKVDQSISDISGVLQLWPALRWVPHASHRLPCARSLTVGHPAVAALSHGMTSFPRQQAHLSGSSCDRTALVPQTSCVISSLVCAELDSPWWVPAPQESSLAMEHPVLSIWQGPHKTLSHMLPVDRLSQHLRQQLTSPVSARSPSATGETPAFSVSSVHLHARHDVECTLSSTFNLASVTGLACSPTVTRMLTTTQSLTWTMTR